MATFRYAAALLALGLAGCQRTPAIQEPGATLVGTWHLTDRQCNCPPGQALPDETLAFTDASHFQLSRGKQQVAAGTYAFSTGSACAGGAGTQALLTLAAAAGTPVPSGAYTLQNGTLVIDQCLAADGSRYTYTRQ